MAGLYMNKLIQSGCKSDVFVGDLAWLTCMSKMREHGIYHH